MPATMPTSTHTSKRKLPDGQDLLSATTTSNKKPRTTEPTRPPGQTAPSNPSHYFQAHTPLLARLHGRYDILTLSILSSTNINKHVARALAHLDRFSSWDPSVLPGVVFFSAKTSAANKLVTVAEVVRRRVGESEQKWWQYNMLSEVECEEEGEVEVVEDSMLGNDQDQYFETMGLESKTVHERATAPTRTRRTAYVGVLLSQTPVGEIAGLGDVAVQTNEAGIEARRRKAGATR